MGIVYGRNIEGARAKWRQGITFGFEFDSSQTRNAKSVRPRINRNQLKPSTAPPIKMLKQIGGAKLFSRYVPKASSDGRELEYGAEYRNAVHYAPTPEAAIRGLKQQLANRVSQDDELLTLQSGIRAGLDEECIRQFCTDNDLNPAASITRRDLRKAVLRRRALNCSQYRVGLGKVKVFLSCR